LITKGFLF